MSVSKGQIMGMRGIGIDITERKIAEEELRESEERFRNIFNHAVEGILIADISTQKFLYANPAICTMLGYSAQELTSMGMSDIHPEKDLAHVQEEFMVQARGEKTLAKSLPVLRKDRDVRYMDINTTPVIIDGHHCNLGLFTDTTERNLAEEALCDTEERYKSLFDRSLDCVYLHDFTGNFIEANQAGLTLLGYTRDEITSLNFTSLLTPDQVSTALKVNQEILATGTQQKPAEFRVRRKDGGYVDVITIASIIYQNGKPYAVQGIAHDITERKRAEEALKDSEEKFRILSEQSVLGIGIIQDGIYQYFNEGYCVISGYSADEIRHWKPYEYAKTVHPDDREFVMDQIQKKQMNSPDVVTHYSFRGINKEGAVLVLDLYSKTIMYQGRPADFVTFIDITERKRVEEALHESEKK
jgi:PAS domain S-box-containing protein